jgi:integrase/recombinase XerD
VRIISCVPLLTAWINAHPSKNDPDAHLWLTNRGDVPSHTTIITMLDSVAKRAGIKKPVNPHSFRHSRATRLACHLTEAQMKEHFGWVQASKMASVYVHLSGRDVDDALLRVYGLKKDDATAAESHMKPKSCSRCKTQNPCTNRFCSLCGLPLDPGATAAALQDDIQRRQADGILDRMLEDPAFKEQFLRKLKDTVASGPRT